MSLSLQRQTELKDMLLKRESYTSIARKYSISRSTITKYKKKLRISVLPNKGGRPRLINDKAHCHLVHCIMSGRVNTAAEAKRVLGINASTQTVRKALRAAGLCAHTKVKKPLLRLHHRQQHLEFAYTHQNKTLKDWEHYIFSDKTKINRMGSDGWRYCWKAHGEGLSTRTTQATVKHGGGSTMIWGCMSMKGVGRMCVIDGIMDATKYVKILDQNLLAIARDHSMH